MVCGAYKIAILQKPLPPPFLCRLFGEHPVKSVVARQPTWNREYPFLMYSGAVAHDGVFLQPRYTSGTG